MASGDIENDKSGPPLFSFDELSGKIRENVERLGWTTPMPVQERVVPIMAAKKDIVVQSRTGSGKTGAFVIPLCRLVDPGCDDVQALVLVPTRELAEQVSGVVRELSEGTGIRSVAVYGGAAYGPQIDAFNRKVHIVVATPGRMIDHLMSRRVSLKRLRCLVLDEADEMLSMGFYQSMVKILSFVPEKRQTTLFSATIPPSVSSLATRFTRDAEQVSLSSDVLHVEEVDHVYYVVDPMYKDRALLRLIEMDNLESALIFCNTKREAEYLGTFLQNFGYDGDFLSGDLSQKERDKVMGRLREGHLRFLVATDVAARGIDISNLGYVILYNLPQAHDHYIHRAGRTGRAGEGGMAISLVSIIEELELKKRAKSFSINLVKKDLPTDEELEAKVAERLRVMLEEKFRGLGNLERERLGRFIPLARSLSTGSEPASAAATGDEDQAHSGDPANIIAMLFDRFYQDTLHKPLFPREEKVVRERSDPQPRHKKGRGSGRRGRRNEPADGGKPRARRGRPRSGRRDGPKRDGGGRRSE